MRNGPSKNTAVSFARVQSAVAQFRAGVQGDFQLMRDARAKYLNDSIAADAWPREVVTRIGLQMMVAIRGMHLLRDAGLHTGAQLASRLIRHVYGAEIHWQSRWEPGVNIVHGNGLVVGAGAHIETGCLLLHNVTLGDAYDAQTGSIGGPQLGQHVHIGPGSSLLGPIHVGDHSKIMAGSLLDQSVPPRSLVRPAPAVVTSRNNRTEDALPVAQNVNGAKSTVQAK
jgi:serine O-acetyltransferase